METKGKPRRKKKAVAKDLTPTRAAGVKGGLNFTKITYNTTSNLG